MSTDHRAESFLLQYTLLHCKEEVPADALPLLGCYVTITHYINANLMHDLVTGRLVTGCIHFFNQTPIDVYTKKQATVETATYGFEFVAAIKL
jgi:hypothetical protein